MTQDPLLSPYELGIYLNDPNIHIDRAAQMIDRAQMLCLTVVDPLPAAATVVVERVAGRAYRATTSSRQTQLEAVGSPLGVAGTSKGGVWLSGDDEQDLRRLSGAGGGAFSIDMLPAGYVAPVTPWSGIGWDLYL